MHCTTIGKTCHKGFPCVFVTFRADHSLSFESRSFLRDATLPAERLAREKKRCQLTRFDHDSFHFGSFLRKSVESLVRLIC